MAYLDNNGVAYLWGKIKTALTGKLDTAGNAYRSASIPWAQVDSTSTSTAYTATAPGITELRDGVCVMLMNGVVTSESGFTVNINDLGAKPVYSTLSAASRATTLLNVNYTLLLVYNSHRISGGCWDAYYGYDSNTNTIGYQLRTNSLSLPMKSVTSRYRLLFTSADNEHFVPANTSTSTNATASRTVCQDPINPFGKIVYYGTTSIVASGSRPSASALWSQYGITLGYSFNRTGAALTLTAWKPVYIKCAPQSDGSAIIDSTTPYVQDLPSTADGKIYIFLGIATSATAVEIVPEHPVYYDDGSKICLWTGATATASLPSGSANGDILVWNDSEWGIQSFTTVLDNNLADNTAAERIVFTATGMTEGSTVTSVDTAVIIMFAMQNAKDKQLVVATSQTEFVSLQTFYLNTTGILGVYTIYNGQVLYALLSTTSSTKPFTGTLHVLPILTSSDVQTAIQNYVNSLDATEVSY